MDNRSLQIHLTLLYANLDELLTTPQLAITPEQAERLRIARQLCLSVLHEVKQVPQEPREN